VGVAPKKRLGRAGNPGPQSLRMCPDEWLSPSVRHLMTKTLGFAVERLQWELVSDARFERRDGGRRMRCVAALGARRARTWAREHGIARRSCSSSTRGEVLTARVAERNRALPEGAPRLDPAVVAFWNDRIERPDADELALFDRPTERRLALDGLAVRSTSRARRQLARAAAERSVVEPAIGAVVMTVCGPQTPLLLAEFRCRKDALLDRA